ncbi:uncharacterized protein LOC118242743 [Electrophorus electricus]|uniref:uncharacterized protein LOC118242743 n=1 Tax=Electrophorus electricus TaxID=8005 RepID=UPI0015D08863|nr:uncharacterized protein LOC118242743 [Electrophorus electricus]
MVEVSGPEGVIMVHRHWTTDDIMKAADGLSKPGDIGGRRFGQELMAFVQSCRPTQAELRRLLMIRLGLQYNRIDRNWVNGDVRLHLPEWNAPPQGQPDLNSAYREIRGLIERVEAAYPTTVNTDVIAACKQRDDEPVADFLVRLTRVHTDHCGIDAPAQRAMGPGEVGAWEAHLRNSFLMNMRKEISDLIRKNCIGYSRAPLSTIEEHAKHHETILGKKDAKRERQRADTTHQAMLTLVQTAGDQGKGRGRENNRGRGRGHGRGRDRGKGRGGKNEWMEKQERYNCGKLGHFARNCPEEDNSYDGGTDLDPTIHE